MHTLFLITIFLPWYIILAAEYFDCGSYEERRWLLITMLSGLMIFNGLFWL